jgi:hypothetical protein
MALWFPKVDRYIDTVAVRTLDPATPSGFVEDVNVTHAHFMQQSDGWIMRSGRTTTASLDRQGRLSTLSYRFWMPFTGWAGPDQHIAITAHEFGNLIVLDFGPSLQNVNIAAATSIDSAGQDIPASLRPVVRKTAVVNVLDDGDQKLGTVELKAGKFSIWAGPLGTPFTANALGGFLNFQMVYDKNS